jgi:hypothetical protein
VRIIVDGIEDRSGEKIKLLANPKPDPSKYGDYCAASVALFQEITSLKQNEAGLLMRQILSGKYSYATDPERQTVKAETDRPLEATVADFAAAPGHECFQAFRVEMSVYVQDGRADTIQQAWDMAVARHEKDASGKPKC